MRYCCDIVFWQSIAYLNMVYYVKSKSRVNFFFFIEIKLEKWFQRNEKPNEDGKIETFSEGFSCSRLQTSDAIMH